VDTVRIGVAQIPQTNRIPDNASAAIAMIERAAREGVELLCFPETHLAGYRVGVSGPDGPCDAEALDRALARIGAACRDHAVGAIVGTETPNSGAKPFNSAVVFDHQGGILAIHHKTRLTPGDALGYSPGTEPTLFEFKGITMGVVICFEGFRFPETTRSLARAGARIVFHPQFNHVLPNMEWKLPVHEALLTARAAENTVYFVSANMCHARNNCRSLIIGPDGLILQASELGKEALLVADIDPRKANHAFLKDDLAAMAKALAET
jgi:ribosomal-protein-alanine N-acetyltransferase